MSHVFDTEPASGASSRSSSPGSEDIDMEEAGPLTTAQRGSKQQPHSPISPQKTSVALAGNSGAGIPSARRSEHAAHAGPSSPAKQSQQQSQASKRRPGHSKHESSGKMRDGEGSGFSRGLMDPAQGSAFDRLLDHNYPKGAKDNIS